MVKEKLRKSWKKIKGTLGPKKKIQGQPVKSDIDNDDSSNENVGTGSRTRPSTALSANSHHKAGEGDVPVLKKELSGHGPLIKITGSPKDFVDEFQRSRHPKRQSTGSSEFLTSHAQLTRDSTGLSATLTDVTAYTTWRDNGEKFAAEYIAQQTIDDIPPQDTDTSVPYVKKIKDLLIAHEIQSDWQQTPTFFIPRTDLVAILNRTCVERVLKDILDVTSPEGVAKVAQICGTDPPDSESGEEALSFRKVLAALIRIGKHESILDFMRHDPPISDQVLPLHMVYNSAGERCGLALGSSRSSPISFTTGWKVNKLQKFSDFQWSLSPTFFAVDGNKDNGNHKKVHYECPAGTVLPFVHQPSRSNTLDHPSHQSPSNGHPDPSNGRQEPKSGGNSVVSFHKLHTSQQNLRRYTAEGPDRPVAVKKLNNTSSYKDFENELKMLIKLTPLPTPHLAKLLVTFEIQGKTATERDYCFMSEQADSNLQDLWSKDPLLLAESSNLSPTELSQWVIEQCHGLAAGMKSIHDYRYEHDSNPDGTPPPRHGFHGDVKPDNILVYKSWVGHNHPLGVLQITDFGISSFHHTASLSGITRGRDSHPYRPPESHLPFMKTTQSHDIWTLGCLFLDFVTWLVKGPAALTEFREERRSYGFNDKDTITTFYQVDEQRGKTVISISQAVLDWSRDLCKHARASKFICDLVILITREMLVIEATGTKSSTRRGTSSAESSQGLAAIPTANPFEDSPANQVPDSVPTKRITAGKLVEELGKMIGRDDNYFVEPVQQGEIPEIGNQYDGTRQSITFQMTLEQIAEVSIEQTLLKRESEDALRNGKVDGARLDVIQESGYVTEEPEVDVSVAADELPGRTLV